MNRQQKSEARRKAILDVALTEFSVKGYAEARMDAIARSAGVAKGTLYLYFQDKEGLFNGLLADVFAEMREHAQDVQLAGPLSLREKLLRVYAPLMDRGSRAARVVRLVYAEGLRTPELVSTYYRSLLAPLLAMQRERLHASGMDSLHPSLAQFPQLLVSPLIHALLWNDLFGDSLHLDVQVMYNAYLNMVLPLDGEEGKRR